MLGPDFLPLPMHAGALSVIHLHAIHADVALASLRIARDHAWQSYKTPRIFWPALQNWQVLKIKVIFANDFFAWTGRDCFREKLAHLGQHGKHFDFVEKSLRRLHVHELANA